MNWIAGLLIIISILIVILPLFFKVELNENIRWAIALLFGLPGIYIAISEYRLRLKEHEKPRRESLLNQVIRPLCQKLQKQVEVFTEHLEVCKYAANIIYTDKGCEAPKYYGFSIMDISEDVHRDFQKTHKDIWLEINSYLEKCHNLNEQLKTMYHTNGALNAIRTKITKIIVVHNNEIASKWRTNPEREKELYERIAPYDYEGRDLLKYYGRGSVALLYVDEDHRLQIKSDFGSPLPYLLPFIMSGGEQQTLRSELLWTSPPPQVALNQLFQNKRQELLSLLEHEDMQYIIKFHKNLEETKNMAQTLLKQLEELVDQYRVDYGLK